jgi:hypothetical protein
MVTDKARQTGYYFSLGIAVIDDTFTAPGQRVASAW